MTKLEFSELTVGMRIIDNEGNIGIIIKIKNIQSILVKFETGTGGYGFYCIDPSYKNSYDPLYKKL